MSRTSDNTLPIVSPTILTSLIIMSQTLNGFQIQRRYDRTACNRQASSNLTLFQTNSEHTEPAVECRVRVKLDRPPVLEIKHPPLPRTARSEPVIRCVCDLHVHRTTA
uniref:Uncharacterized protein n=1 Tax=Anopheles melas TaxID=34690 RepID=A0A182TUZ2_9DIPT